MPDIPEAEQDLDVCLDDITEDEVRETIKSTKFKNEKAPGEGGIYPEMLKAESQEIPKHLCHIFQMIWENLPEEWKTGLIIKLLGRGTLLTAINGEA